MMSLREQGSNDNDIIAWFQRVVASCKLLMGATVHPAVISALYGSWDSAICNRCFKRKMIHARASKEGR